MRSPLSDDLESRVYLSDISPKDKPWDARRAEADIVANLYAEAGYEGYSERMSDCSRRLEFAVMLDDLGDRKFHLQAARFCRVRFCPVCQWRKGLMWRARLFKGFPKIIADYPSARFIFLTFTVKNCPLDELRDQVKAMNEAWHRLANLKTFPALGFVRSLEVTRSEDGLAHPHFHVLMMVKSSYFSHGYIKQSEWTEMWRQSLRVEYTPVINVQAVKNLKPSKDTELSEVAAGVCETLKYSVKPSDLIQDSEWLDGLTQQMHKLRSVSLGGIFRQYLKETEPEDLIHSDDDAVELSEDAYQLFALWDGYVKRYRIKP